ncbi:hypothetical protein Fmac_004656 [Flemingia macrophylla]|uniref:Uncharacterized protein n=1 Tax=Flemingia macrophylla TaxID=520843 RepID=A0ABD1N5L3_9FABA
MDLHGNPHNSGLKKRKPEQDALTSDHGNSMSVGESSGSGDLCKSSTSGSLNSNNQNGSNSDNKEIRGRDSCIGRQIYETSSI